MPSTMFNPNVPTELLTQGDGNFNNISVWRDGEDLVIQEDGVQFRTDYQNVGSLKILAGGGNDTISILTIQADTNIPVLIDGQGGYDSIYLSANEHSLDNIEPALITVDGGGTGADSGRLNIYDQSNEAAASYDISSTAIDHSNGEPVFYSRIDEIDLFTTEDYPEFAQQFDPHEINILSTAAGTHIDIWVGLSNTQINIGGDEIPGGVLSGLAGSVSIIGAGPGNEVNFKDTWAATAGSYQIGSQWVTRLFPGGSSQVAYYDVGPVTFDAGPHNDVFTVAWNNLAKSITVHGNGGNDRLVAFNRANAFALTAAGSGNLNNQIFFDSFYHLEGGNQIDSFRFANGLAGFGGLLTGGGGTDFLDYFAATSNVNASLAAGAGTSGVEAIIGGSRNDILTGNVAHNILIGGPGNDTLNGESGRDLLIGGDGADTINGGPGEDILVGGRTSYDANSKALSVILADWAEDEETWKYSDHVNRLREPGAIGGPGLFYPLNAANVTDTSKQDRLTGGADHDWFFDSKIEVLDRGSWVVGNQTYWEEIY